MAEVFDKWFNELRSELEIWEIAKIFGQCLRYMAHGLSI